MFRSAWVSKNANRSLRPMERVPAFAAPNNSDRPPVGHALVRHVRGSCSRFLGCHGRHTQIAVRGLAPLFVALMLSSISAYAQGTVDLSGVTTAMSSVVTTCKLAGALAVVIGIIFGVFQFMGRNIAQGFMAIGGGLFAGIVIGFAPQWVSSLTGQSVSMVVMHATQVLG
jgi:hypothetical protein